jgi:class 3 adenylate cyclase
VAEGSGKDVVILFADVVGSTQLYEAMGDERARETVQRCLKIMREATEQFGGTVVKTVGDEVMATFPSADDAMNASSQMQNRISSASTTGTNGTPVAIRIGCHFGPVMAEDRDIYGAAVNTANRMTSQAKAGQILTTAATVEQLSAEWRALSRQIDIAKVKGHAGELALFEVLWQPEEATSMLPAVKWREPDSEARVRLRLRFRGQELVLGDPGPNAASMGRADENDVVIKGNLISRVHARIDRHKNRFVLVDESTNGTFIQRDDGEEVYVRRDSTELTGSGVIGMGRVAARGTLLAIEYVLEQ